MLKLGRLGFRHALGYALVAALSSQSSAQTFVELGVGPDYATPRSDAASDFYRNGFTIRASFGREFARHFGLRLDGTLSRFNQNVQVYPPCPSAPAGCTREYFEPTSSSVVSLSANALVPVDSRKIFYLVGGAGYYGTRNQFASDQHFGISAGAGVAIPITHRWRGVVEGRYHAMLSGLTGPFAVVPITAGFRY